MEVTTPSWPGNMNILQEGKTKTVCLPSVYMVPANQSYTMLTVMIDAQKLTKLDNNTESSQTTSSSIKCLSEVGRVYNDLFINFIPRLGG